MAEKPPPILGNGRLLEYAVVDESVRYSGRSLIFVGFKELGPVPFLAITKDFKTGEIALLYCDREWDVLATGGCYESLEQAKESAERTYHGISSRWIDAKVTEKEALEYRDAVWADSRCSFCDTIPPDFDMLMARDNARICSLCIEKFHKILEEDRAKK